MTPRDAVWGGSRTDRGVAPSAPSLLTQRQVCDAIAFTQWDADRMDGHGAPDCHGLQHGIFGVVRVPPVNYDHLRYRL